MNPHVAFVHAQQFTNPAPFVLLTALCIAALYFIEYHRELSSFKTHQVIVGSLIEATKDVALSLPFTALFVMVAIIFSFSIAGQTLVRTSDLTATFINAVTTLWPFVTLALYAVKRWQAGTIARVIGGMPVRKSVAFPTPQSVSNVAAGGTEPLARSPQGWPTLEDLPKN